MIFNILMQLILVTSFLGLNLFSVDKDPDSPEGQYQIGLLYFDGKEGYRQNLPKAYRLFSLAAKQGYADAQYHIGFMNFYGYSVKENYDEALKWFLLAGNQGHSEAQYHLGLIYNGNSGFYENLDRFKDYIRPLSKLIN